MIFIGAISSARVLDASPEFQQLTSRLQKSNSDLPDPALFVDSSGAVEIYGSASYGIRYKNWDEFDRAGLFDLIPLSFRQPNGKPIGRGDSRPWDVRKYRLIHPSVSGSVQTEETIYLAGVMTTPEDRGIPVWPKDNANRRIFLIRDGIRSKEPLVGQIGTGFVDHNYGGNFFQPESPDPSVIIDGLPLYLFFEKVSRIEDGRPLITNVYVQQMDDFRTPSHKPPIEIVDVGLTPAQSKRSKRMGGYLLEGPRPFVHREIVNGKPLDYLILGLSGGCFCTDHYSILFAYAPLSDFLNPEAWELIEAPDGSVDFSNYYKQKFGMSWVGRPFLYTNPEGKTEFLFHGLRKSDYPSDTNYSDWPSPRRLFQFFREIYKQKDVHIWADALGKLHLDYPGLRNSELTGAYDPQHQENVRLAGTNPLEP